MSNRRQLLLLVAGIVVLAVLNVWLSRSASVGSDVTQRGSLLDFPDDAVSMLVIRRAGDPMPTVMMRSGEWRLLEPFAASVDEQTVLRLVDALAYSPIVDRLSDQELVRLGRNREDFGLRIPRLSVRVRAGERESGLQFGSFTPSGAGVYVALDEDGAVYVAPSNLLAAVDVPASRFRRRALLPAGIETVSALDLKRGGEALLRFVREDEGWKMVQPRESPASATRVRKLLDLLRSAEAVDFVWPVGLSNEVSTASAALLSGYGLDPENAVTISCKGLNGVDLQLSLGAEAKDGLVYALVHNGTAIVTVDQALKEAASVGQALFADARLFPYEPEQVSGIALTLPESASCLLAKNEKGEWRMDAPVSAPAEKAAVEELLARILELQSADVTAAGITVALSPAERSVIVPPWTLGMGFRVENLCAKTILAVEWPQVKRLTQTASPDGKLTAIAFDADRRVWNVESSSLAGTVSRTGIDAVREVLTPLTALRIVALKVSADALRDYGLETPALTIAVDFVREDSVRRNLMIGDRTQDGYFATIGAADVVFVLPEKTVQILSAAWIEE